MLSFMDTRAFYYISVPLLIFFIIPGALINNNPDGFPFIDPRIFIVVMCIGSVTLCAFLALIDLILRSVKSQELYAYFLRFCFFYTLITGIFLRVSIITGMEDPSNSRIDWIHLVLSFICAYVLTLLSFSKRRYIVFISTLTFFCGNFFIVIYGMYSLEYGKADSLDAEKESLRRLSDTKNILVLSFDGIPRDIAVDIIKNDETLQRDFSDFVVFENAISSSPATNASLSGELYGNTDFKSKADTENELRFLRKEQLLTNFLDTHGYQVSTYGQYIYGFDGPGAISLVDFRPLEKTIRVLRSYDYALSYFGTRYAVRFVHLIDWKAFFLTAIRKFIGNSKSYSVDRDLLDKIYKSYGPAWDKHLLRTVFDFEDYVRNLHVIGSDSSAKFLHFTHTHYPVDFDSECDIRSDDKAWYKSHQNREGVLGEVYCALSQLVFFLERLKSLGVYDRSLIVLKSDHGKPASYYDKSDIDSFRIREHPYWGYGRYTPLLMIKDFDHRSDAIKYKDDAAMTDDLARTICINSGIDAGCDHYPGFDLLDDDLSIPDNAKSVIFVVQDSQSDHSYDTHEALYLDRKKDFFSNINSALVAELLSESVRCGSKTTFEGSRVFNNGFSDYESWASWTVGNVHSLRFRVDSCASRAKLVIEADGPAGAERDIVASVDAPTGPQNLELVNIEQRDGSLILSYQLDIVPTHLDEIGSILLNISPNEESAVRPISLVSIEIEE